MRRTCRLGTLAGLALLGVTGCRRAAPPDTQQHTGAAVVTTDGRLSASNLDASIEGHLGLLADQPRSAAVRGRVVELLTARASSFGRLADYDRAEEIGEEGVRLSPKDSAAWQTRASIRNTLHRFREALADLDQAGRLHAPGVTSEALRASALLGLGRVSEAVVLRRTLAKRRPDISSLTGLGIAEAAAGDTAAAEVDLDRALQSFRDVSPFPVVVIEFQRGLMAERAGNLEGAADWYRAVARRLPGHAQAAVHLAGVALARGDLATVAAALSDVPPGLDDPEVLAARADLAERKGHKDEAQRLRSAAKTRYAALIERHPAAFADHAARFFLPREPAEALRLALLNLGSRPTGEAYELALGAAQAAGDASARCRLGRAAATVESPTTRLTALVSAARESCPETRASGPG